MTNKFVRYLLIFLVILRGQGTLALLDPQFGRLRLLLLSLLLELLAHLLVGEPVHLLAGLLTVDHLQPEGCK